MANQSKPFRVVHITTVPLSLFFFRGQVAYMKGKGVDFQIISSPGELLDQFAERESVQAHPVRMERSITPLKDLGAIARLLKTLRRIRPEILHAHTPKGGLLGMIAGWIACVPIRIYHIRGLPYMTASGTRRRLLILSEWVSCKLATEVLCVSPSIRDVAIHDGVCSPNKIKVLLGGSGNGVDAKEQFNPDRFSDESRRSTRERFAIAENDVVVGFFGRIVRDKGIEELSDAWARIRERHRNASLMLVGPIEPQDPVSHEHLQRLRSDDRVHFIDRVDDPSGLYAICNLVVLPTYREGFPNVPIEAAAMRIPVVATNVPGCIDAVVDGLTGTLVPPANASALESAIVRYIDDPELRRAHGIAGRERVLQDFAQEQIWDALYEEYQALMNRK